MIAAASAATVSYQTPDDGLPTAMLSTSTCSYPGRESR